MELPKLKIDPEFKNLIPPLRGEEYAQLRKNILREGCHDPLTVWGETILDGHNRYRICTANPKDQIPFDIRYAEFESREAAMDWIDRNQAGRRNLTDEDWKMVIGRIYNRTKKPQGGDHKSKVPVEPLKPTAESIAKEYGVSVSTVKRAGKFAETVKEIQKAEPDLERPQVIEKAKEMTKRKDHLKPKHKEEKPEEPKCEPKQEKEIIRPLGHEVAMRYARMAVLQLESIHRNDHDKDEAFDFVIEWINQHR